MRLEHPLFSPSLAPPLFSLRLYTCVCMGVFTYHLQNHLSIYYPLFYFIFFINYFLYLSFILFFSKRHIGNCINRRSIDRYLFHFIVCVSLSPSHYLGLFLLLPFSSVAERGRAEREEGGKKKKGNPKFNPQIIIMKV